MVCESDMTSEIGRELELPKTPMAMTKLEARLLKRKHFATIVEDMYETKVRMTKMKGITARSASLSALSCDASLVNTATSLR